VCGIVGYMSLTGRDGAVGQTVLSMLTGLARRGPDSAGAAIFRSEPGRSDVCWVRLPAGMDPDDATELVRSRLTPITDIRSLERRPGLVRLELAGGSPAHAVLGAIERPSEDFEVVSLGSQMELVKQVGHPDDLDATFDIARIRGSHGIGHTRLSTESRVDLSHSQPFWVRGIPDMATVHNGHITNYHKLRTIYEQRGVRFFTENDSEVVGVYLADQLSRGLTLEEALEASLEDLDGSFTYLVATSDAIGYARDPFALKPLITVETPDYVAIANEEMAIRTALGSAGVAHEPSGHVFRVWQRTPAPVAAAA
jgi:methylamine---glutamate N-methyltransferase subunit A